MSLNLLNYFNLGIKPKIIIHPCSQVVTLDGKNERLLLTCQAEGAKSYNWERKDGSIPSGATGVNTTTLTIVNLKPEDAGSYRCVVINHRNKKLSDYARITISGQ